MKSIMKLTAAQIDILHKWQKAARKDPQNAFMTVEKLKRIRPGAQVKAVNVLIQAGYVNRAGPHLYRLVRKTPLKIP